MSKIIPKAYVCGKITGDGKVLSTEGHIYRFRKNCQKYCDRLNADDPMFAYQVLVSDNWHLCGEEK
ncbi:hypothetical protein [Companilactobacillus nodensis]|uniref:Uncharacterized protein n=1 Tax=Companilactobacillus nodensis DSM 19682 = JCM 14932 = NBRC 107160 TaxID=1423775 RepID=A0A0R1KHK9_9LACO|nr:hypothetical protein [Companilactobacillus nodensis]KRK79466.1 hypothetical protein FD03_GL000596 [Companilactobacillus nodensis DSM 19682 = JCM 14932 = NBRC 107160]